MHTWESRFSQKIAADMEDFNASIHFDKNLFLEDIEVSLTHIDYLTDLGVLDAGEKKKITEALKAIKQEGIPKNLQTKYEDIHSLVEHLLKKKIGALAGKLHTARSRNDLVATDLRLFVSKETDLIRKKILHLLHTLYELANSHQTVILPGFTHLQGAQPITFSFYCLSYFFMLARDYERLGDNQKRTKLSPLGSGAFSGVNYPNPRLPSAQKIGFLDILPNAMDAVSSRDFLIEFHANLSIIMTHLSRLAEDFIIYSNKQFDFIAIDEKYSTGSSIMPNKKNADSLELIRGKSGRVFGNLMGLLTVLKGLPMAYNKDLQEDKEGSFDSNKTVQDCLTIMNAVLETISINSKKMELATEKGYLQATDVADYLVGKNVPFREAHAISGALVKHLDKNDKLYSDLSLEEIQVFSPLLEKDILEKISLKNIIENKKSTGSTSFREVKKQLQLAAKKLKKFSKE